MFKLLEKRPFLSGFIVGFISVGIVSKKLKKLIKGKVTIVSITLQENKDYSSTEEKPEISKEN